ncbi:MAG: polysaccharide biosynthesis protein [Leptolyngbya sp.]|nr:polysaccharide biosynthesis protein [Candidatus Melainabacteria bacterium]
METPNNQPDPQNEAQRSNALAAASPAVSEILETIRWKRLMQVFFDGLIIFTALAGAFLIRFDGHLNTRFFSQLFIFAPIFIFCRLIANWGFGVYRRLWRYTGLTEVMELGCSVLTVTTLLTTLRGMGLLNVAGSQLSYGIIMIDCGLCFLLLCASRVLRRLQTEHSQRRHWRQPVRKRALVVGAGDAGQMVLKELAQRADLGVDVVGMVDDDPMKLKRRIGSITVFGATTELKRLCEVHFVDQVIIAMPSAPPQEIRRIVDICRDAEVEPRILPGLFELIDGRVSVSQLREVSLEDLLGRDPITLDSAAISSYIEGRTVLVTGAGGSIGSELCRQILKFQPKRILILGRGENSIFTIQQELKKRPEPVEIIPVIADVRDETRMKSIFERYRPQVVFHAAAHKHVPLMEENVPEAITNNVRGTQILADFSDRFKVETFVLVSSDKAVNPSSVMGATKRMAEMIVQSLDRRSGTRYSSVRFGNVLASRGSVIPLWKQQIAQGGPVTVTHADATRYFMLIPESVQLILQAGALAAGGEIFVLDMGKPVRIMDLAYDLIRFSGLRPNQDIKVEVVGLRPGEKLHEELLTAEEGLTKTTYEKIFVGQPQDIDHEWLYKQIDGLVVAAKADDEEIVRSSLDKIVGGALTHGKSA